MIMIIIINSSDNKDPKGRCTTGLDYCGRPKLCILYIYMYMTIRIYIHIRVPIRYICIYIIGINHDPLPPSDPFYCFYNIRLLQPQRRYLLNIYIKTHIYLAGVQSFVYISFRENNMYKSFLKIYTVYACLHRLNGSSRPRTYIIYIYICMK